MSPKSFAPRQALPRDNGDLSSSVIYNGTYDECFLDENSTLRIELERVFKVSDIGILNGSSDFAFGKQSKTESEVKFTYTCVPNR